MVSQLPAQQREEEKGDLLTGDNNKYLPKARQRCCCVSYDCKNELHNMIEHWKLEIA